MKKTLLFILVAGAAMAQQSHAVLIAGFNFNNNTAGLSGALGTFNTTGTVEVFNSGTEVITPATHGTLSASASANLSGLVGTMGGTANNNWGTFAGDLANAVTGDTSGGALAVVGSGNNSSAVIFSISMLSYQDLVVTYGTRGTSSGFTTHTWDYSTDGSSYTNFSTIAGRNATAWSTQTVDLSSVSALDNDASVFLRLTFSGATATNGNNRIDNVQFTAVPEPTTALLGLGSLGLLLRRRRD